MPKVDKVAFEKVETRDGAVVFRLIAFAKNDAGVYVEDILECYALNEKSVKYLAEVPEYRYPGAEIVVASVLLDDIDTGYARKLGAKIYRALQQIETVPY